MKRSINIVLLMLFIIAGCGTSDKETNGLRTADMLPEMIGSTGISQVGDVHTYLGENLYQYIDGGAELYHKYGFIEVSTADYQKSSAEMVADIYQFDTPLHAYGLYSMFRPENPDFIKLGTEGYTAPATITFTANCYMVKLTAYEDSDETALAMVNLADFIEKQIEQTGGESGKPTAFNRFPTDLRVDGTDQFWAAEFAGQKFMTSVYSVDYLIDSVRITLFFSDEEPDRKMLDWSVVAEQTGKLKANPDGLTFDDDKGFTTTDGYYGTIVVGMKGVRLVGVLGYEASLESFVAGWLNSLGSPEAP